MAADLPRGEAMPRVPLGTKCTTLILLPAFFVGGTSGSVGTALTLTLGGNVPLRVARVATISLGERVALRHCSLNCEKAYLISYMYTFV